MARHPGLAFIALAGIAAMAGLAQAATTERVVVDRYTGLALGGFDPVAYFTDARPMAGRPGFEVSEAGAVWRFHNEGNRAFFLADPEIYGPQFGGYDPTDAARGVAVAGNPQLWLISGQRLFLFGAAQSRDAFAADPGRILREAKQRWPGLKETLAR
ncbi:MAG TPA: YHS domain-containing (seleno)protein [Bradyrhizobium sp.]|nr:YHS domain-containing (seleno)protein [Bradyrhizobium sp.]